MPPSRLYRFRPLTEELLERELNALKDSYLYSPSFAAMNDPMEAFYETGGPGDEIVDAMLAPTGKKIADMYTKLVEMINGFALVSFAGTYQDLPMWAYYASNFAGMCLEFSTVELDIGDLQLEELKQVTYERSALPPLSISDMASDRLLESVTARMIRKRIEWAHEKEWRFVTGQVGPKHYLDDALCRVFLGSRAKSEHITFVCELLDQRPVEVLHGEINGFDLTFKTIKPARSAMDSERVGAGSFDQTEHLYAEKELREFLEVPFEALVDECRRTALRPNMEELAGVDISVNKREAIYFRTIYKLRNGRNEYEKRYFDRRMRLIPN